MSVAERVRKLAALAGSANEHEASAAARQACRLIREGKVVVEDARGEAPSRGRAPWDAWAQASPPAARRRSRPMGPFARRRELDGMLCGACGELIELGDAFSSASGFVHGDCIPAEQRP